MDDATITRTIDALYAETGVTRPTAERSVAPLSALLYETCLSRSEVTNLTGRRASDVLCREVGAVFEEGDDEPLAGLLYVGPYSGVLFVEADDIVTRRRFSAAHELGHYLLHFRPVFEQNSEIEFLADAFVPGESDGVEGVQDGRLILAAGGVAPDLPEYDDMEREANRFAADLLMPEDVVRALAENTYRALKGDDLVWRLASEMLVSRAAMRWRLRRLGLYESIETVLGRERSDP